MYVQSSYVKRKGKDGRNRKLVESFRDPNTGKPRNRTVQKLEKLPLLERARIIYKYRGYKHLQPEEWMAMQSAGDFDTPHTECYIGDSYAGAGTSVLLHYIKSKGLQEALLTHLGNKDALLVRDMLIQQILQPGSKRAYAQQRKRSLSYLLDGKVSVEEDTLYNALSQLEEKFPDIRDQLNAGEQQPGRLLLYDLSNSYFTGLKAELGGYGDSKEKRYDRYIVSYGLVANQSGVPLDIQVWKGGTADANTVYATFENWQKKYKAEEAIWIADRAMSGQDNLEEIKDLGLSYITGMPGASEQHWLGYFHEQYPGLFDQPLTEIQHQDNRYVICQHHAKGYHREKLHHKRRRKVYKGLKKIQASPQNKNQNKLYHRCMRLLEDNEQTDCWEISFNSYEDKKGHTRYQLHFRLNRGRVHLKDRIGHFYILQTDLNKEKLSKEDVKQHYQSLFKVERCFRTSKSHLEIRPIRHWKAPQIRAHIYLNYLSLWIVKQIENQWQKKGISQEVVPALRTWDEQLQINEILDKYGQSIDMQWNKGKRSKEVIEEIKNYGELENIKPEL